MAELVETVGASSTGGSAAMQRARELVDEVAHLLETLGPAMGEKPVRLIALERLLHAFGAGPHAVLRAGRTASADIRGRLAASDARAFAAFDLATLLATATLGVRAGDASTLALLSPDRLRRAYRLLADVASAVPELAVAAVRSSLDVWIAWAQAQRSHAGAAVPSADAVRALRLQGDRWAGLLSGAELPAALLAPRDYAQAASHLLMHLEAITEGFVRRRWPLLALAALVIGGLAAAAAIWAAGSLPRTLALVTPALAIAGITWQALRATLTRALGTAGRAIWHAEVSEATVLAGTVQPPHI